MIDLTFITVGTLKEAYLKDAVNEYKKRLLQYAKVDEINIKEETIHNEDDRSEIERALNSEGERILAAIPKNCAVVALCVEGRQFSSEELSEKFREMKDACGRIALIIGSSYGLSDSVKRRADLKLSLSKLTFPHQLMRPILAEVVYRSMTILAGKRYHK